MVTSPSDRLLSTVVDLLVSDGFEGVTIRRVATVAGVSIGAVQHHFPTKDAMLAAAMERVSSQFQQRLRERIGPDDPPGAVLREVADELLGAGPQRRVASVLWIVRLARAAVEEATARTHRREWQEVEDLLARLVGAARPDLAPEQVCAEAGTLLALLDGLAGATAVEPDRMPQQRAELLVARHLDALLE